MACIRSGARAFDPQNIAYRSKYLATSLYGIGVLIFGIIQTLDYQIPLFCFGLTITMVYVYLVSLDDLISIDPLTGLNNRAQLNRYISQEIQHSDPEKKEHSVIMLDLNDFKSINDVYGHIEGDRALVKAAGIIKTACGSDPLRPFIARYGGDEFIIICKTENEDDVVRLIKNIHNAFKAANDNSDTLYMLSAAIGYASFKGSIKSYQKAVERADKRLYLNKEDYYEAQSKHGK
jgi:diguanylate cyclase (GGDEF)-like protein